MFHALARGSLRQCNPALAAALSACPTEPGLPVQRPAHLPKNAALPGGKGGELEVAGQPPPLAIPLPPVTLPGAVYPHHDLRGKKRPRRRLRHVACAARDPEDEA